VCILTVARPKERAIEQVDGPAALRDVVTLLKHSDELTPAHRILVDLEPESVLVAADPGQLRQIFWNLARNAIAAMPDGDGSMLDHSILLYGSNMSNSNAHNHFPLPTLVVGGGCGKIKGGQHLKYPDQTQLSNLLLTLLERAGVPEEKVGNSTGLMSEL